MRTPCPMIIAVDRRFSWLAPMVLWPIAESLLPRPTVRPQGGGTPRVEDEATFAAVVYVLVSECAWRELPKTFNVSWQTAHRRFTQWCSDGLWAKIANAGNDDEARGW